VFPHEIFVIGIVIIVVDWFDGGQISKKNHGGVWVGGGISLGPTKMGGGREKTGGCQTIRSPCQHLIIPRQAHVKGHSCHVGSNWTHSASPSPSKSF
jgi:hypothetical protein